MGQESGVHQNGAGPPTHCYCPLPSPTVPPLAFPPGAASVMHTGKVLRLSLDLPLIIEVVETEEAIQALLPDLDEMIGGGLITLERARVILYRPANVRASQQESHRIEGLEPE